MITRFGPEFWPMQVAPDWTQPGLSFDPVGHEASTHHPIGLDAFGAEPGAISTQIPNKVLVLQGIAAQTKSNVTVVEQDHPPHWPSSQLGRVWVLKIFMT